MSRLVEAVLLGSKISQESRDPYVWGLHLMTARPAEPVIGNTLEARMVHKLARFAGEGEELHERGAIQVAAWVFLGMVRHEIDDEIVCVRRHEPGEWTGEVVWIVLNGVSRGPVRLVCGLVVRETFAFAGQAVQSFPSVEFYNIYRSMMHICVALQDILAGARDGDLGLSYSNNGSISLVSVVCTKNAGRSAQKSGSGGEASTNRPDSCDWIARNGNGDYSQDQREVRRHVVRCSETINGYLLSAISLQSR